MVPRRQYNTGCMKVYPVLALLRVSILPATATFLQVMKVRWRR